MESVVLPVLNGIFPRPDGGTISGVFINPYAAELLQRTGARGSVLLLPFSYDRGTVYPIGVLCRIEKIWFDDIYISQPLTRVTALWATVVGRGRYRGKNFYSEGNVVVAGEIEPIDFRELRRSYPVIDGAGWRPEGGYTEMKGMDDLPVTVYGTDLENGKKVAIRGNLGNLVPPEKAHTVEHAIIRSLQNYALCSSRTLSWAIMAEGSELKASIDAGYRYRIPEIFGVTSSGACGNPLSNLAHFYLAQEMFQNLSKGKPFWDSLEAARLKTLSRITEDLEITSDPEFRVIQGIKKGMLHDDSPMVLSQLKRVIRRFPVSPWD